jgi:RimJ/RimL family protein N-acetyltransferase
MRPDSITTARLVLRRAQMADLAAMHGLLSQPRAMRYWSTPAHASLAETKVWLARMIDRPPSESDDFLIEYHGRVIGKAGAWNLPEVGFLLDPAHWGKGLGVEAMTAVISHLFTHHAMPHLVAEADPRNAASLGLLTRLGFVETHRAQNTMQWGDEWCDSVYLRLDRPKGYTSR